MLAVRCALLVAHPMVAIPAAHALDALAPPHWNATVLELSAGPTFHDGDDDAFAGGMHVGIALRRALGPHLEAGLSLQQHDLRFDPREYPRWVPLTPESYPGDQRITTAGLEARWRLGTARDRVRAFGALGGAVAWPHELDAVYVHEGRDRFTGAWYQYRQTLVSSGDARLQGTVSGGVECALGEVQLAAGAVLRSDSGRELVLNDLFVSVGLLLDPIAEPATYRAPEAAPSAGRPHWTAWGGPATHMAGYDLYQDGYGWGVGLRIPVHPRGAAALGVERAQFDFDATSWASPDPDRSSVVQQAEPRTFTLIALDGVVYTAGPERRLRPYGAAGFALGRTGTASVAYTLSDAFSPGAPDTTQYLSISDPDSYGILSAALGLECRVGPLKTSLQVRYRRSVGGDIEIRDAALGIGY